MALAYAQIREALLRAPDSQGGRLGKLRAAIERDWEIVVPGRLHEQEQRAWAQQFYREMFETRPARHPRPLSSERRDLAVELEPPPALLDARAAAAVRDLFASTEEPALAAKNAPLLQEIAGHVLDYLRFERNALRTVTALQRRINVLLDRPQPSSPLTGASSPSTTCCARIPAEACPIFSTPSSRRWTSRSRTSRTPPPSCMALPASAGMTISRTASKPFRPQRLQSGRKGGEVHEDQDQGSRWHARLRVASSRC